MSASMSRFGLELLPLSQNSFRDNRLSSSPFSINHLSRLSWPSAHSKKRRPPNDRPEDASDLGQHEGDAGAAGHRAELVYQVIRDRDARLQTFATRDHLGVAGHH